MNTFSESTEESLELEHRIHERISGRVQNLRVVRTEGRLILEGSTGSFHAKQLATHAALEFSPAYELINAITVDRQKFHCVSPASRRY
jgi:osmotically-inducible protein OsmY